MLLTKKQVVIFVDSSSKTDMLLLTTNGKNFFKSYTRRSKCVWTLNFFIEIPPHPKKNSLKVRKKDV